MKNQSRIAILLILIIGFGLYIFQFGLFISKDLYLGTREKLGDNLRIIYPCFKTTKNLNRTIDSLEKKIGVAKTQYILRTYILAEIEDEIYKNTFQKNKDSLYHLYSKNVIDELLKLQ